MSRSIPKPNRPVALFLSLLVLGGVGLAQGGGGTKIRTASFRTWEPGLFDAPVESPAAPWGPGDAPDAVRAGRPQMHDGALGSAAVAVGEFQWEETDLFVAGRGPAFVLARRYRSKFRAPTSLGTGWTHAYDVRVEREGADLWLQDGWGRRDRFHANPDGTYTAPGWFAVASERSDGSIEVRPGPLSNAWVFTDPDGSDASAGRLARIEDEHGNALVFAYDPGGDLLQVLDTLGRTYDFVHDAQHRLALVTDFAGRTIRYEYYEAGEVGGNPGDLRAVTSPAVVGTPTGNDFPDGKTTTYTYTRGFPDPESNHNLRTIVNPDGSLLLRNRYGMGPTQGRLRDWLVGQWLAPDRHEFQFHYSFWPAGLLCTVNDEVGNVREYGFDEARGRILVRRYAGRANPDVPTMPRANRPVDPLRSGEESFLTTLRLNNDGCVVERRSEAHGESRVERLRYESDLDPSVEPTRRGNVVQRSWGGGEAGATLLRETYGYDPSLGLLTSRTLPGGETTTVVRDPLNGDLLQILHAEPGVVEDFEYNAFGQLTAHVHPDNGNGQRQRDELEYSTGGPATGYLHLFRRNSDHAVSVSTYSYDLFGNVTTCTDPRGNTTQRSFNELNQLVRVQAPDLQLRGLAVGATTDYHYDANNRCVRIVAENRDENGALGANTHWTTSFAYDARGRVVSRSREIGPGQIELTDYEFLPGRARIRLPRYASGDPFHVVAFDYDERGLLFRRTRAEGHSTDQTTTQLDYDAFGAVARVLEGIESSPRESRFGYDSYGRLVSAVDPMGNACSYEYDDNGNRTRALVEGELVDLSGSANNVRLGEAHWQYDAMNRLVGHQADSFDPATQMPQHDGAYHFLMEIAGTGAVTQLTDDAGEVWTWSRDLNLRTTTCTDPTGQTVQRVHDASGNPVQLVESTLNQRTGLSEVYTTTYAYDEWNRPVLVQDPQQNVWQTRYDSRSLPVERQGPAGRWTSCSFDGLGRMLREEVDLNGNGQGGDAADRTTGFAYDASGNLVARTDDNGHTTTYAYDSLDRRTRRTCADGTFWTWTYDRLGDPVLVRDGNGSLRTQQFDALGRLVVRTIQPGSGVSRSTTREDYAYDGRSRLVSATDDDSSVARTHSSLGHLVREVLNGAGTASTYDALGRLESLTYPSGRQVSFDHDALGRVTQVVEVSDGELVSSLLYAEDRVVRRDLCNGVRSDYDYDGLANVTGDQGVRQLEQAAYFVPQGPMIADLSWSYAGDQALGGHFDGRLLTAEDFQRDTAGRLVQWNLTGSQTANVQYFLDGLGNRTLVSGGPDAGSYFMDATTPDPADFQQSQYTATPFDSRTYDDDGNLVQWTDAGGTRQAAYDYRGQLVEWTDGATGRVHRYAYDALGRMTTRVIDATGAAATVQLRYRRNQLLEEQGAALFTYTYEGEAAHAFERRGGGGELYYLADRDDTVRAVVDDMANVLEYYDYDPFGVATIRDGLGTTLSVSQFSHTPQFRGMRWHEELELYRHARSMFDPRAGRDLTGQASSAGGFDGNSTVDGADFLTWQRGASPAAGVVDGGDLAIWQSQFGSQAAASSGRVDSADFLSWRRSFGSAAAFGEITLERGYTDLGGPWSSAAWAHASFSDRDGTDLLLVNNGDGSDFSPAGHVEPFAIHTSCSTPGFDPPPMGWDNVVNAPWSSSSARETRPPKCVFLWGNSFPRAEVGIVVGQLWNASGPGTSAHISRSDVIFDIIGGGYTPEQAARVFGGLVLERGVTRYDHDDDGDLDLYVVNSPGGDNATRPRVRRPQRVIVFTGLR